MKSRLAIWPPEHFVPAATACQTTLPWLQIPNCSSPLQIIALSEVHVLPPAAGAPDGCEGAGAWVGAAVASPAGAEVTVTSVLTVEVDAAGSEGAGGAAVDEGAEGAVEAGAWVASPAPGVYKPLLPEPPPGAAGAGSGELPPVEPPPPVAAPPQRSTKGPLPTRWTYLPGSLNV